MNAVLAQVKGKWKIKITKINVIVGLCAPTYTFIKWSERVNEDGTTTYYSAEECRDIEYRTVSAYKGTPTMFGFNHLGRF